MTTFSTSRHPGAIDGPDPADPAIFAANISALARRNPRLAEALLSVDAPGTERLRFVVTEQTHEGAAVWSAEYDGRALCSKRRPLDEAKKLAETLDPMNAGCAVVLGFGLGHHVRVLSERLHEIGVVACFEPDLALLRAALERIDHSEWLGRGTTAIFHECDNQGAVTFGVQGWEAPLAIGVQIVEHAPSRPRLGDSGTRFAEVFSSVVGTVRTHVVTTMVQTDVTARNALMNLEHYAGRAGIEGYQGAALGRPALVVSAGPSLKRSIEHLKQPWVRERCVIIAVQTVLKQLLSEGIRPHFVCALDYHEISRRFYEGLTPGDVEGVTLIAEPKANAAILDAFPGDKRLAADEILEEILAGVDGGPGFAGTHAPIRPGATVAHLAYAFGRFLGCDPLILVGQDLAFTDGQYYSAGAAIHSVWSGELNEFNTLEMMEWQRIVRMRGNLHELTDHLGRKVYSDDQMLAYLHQFERDFMQDESRGLTTIDATEGGVRKAHTSAMPLADALALHVRHARTLPESLENTAAEHPASHDEAARRASLRALLKQLRTDVRTIARLSRETSDLLGKLTSRLDDPDRANAIIRQIHALRDRVESLRPAYGLVHRINQAGTFKRFKADRRIRLEIATKPREEQRLRVERDSMNVGWMADAADTLEDLLGAASEALEGKPKRTRDPGPKHVDDNASVTIDTKNTRAVGAYIIADASQGLAHLRATLERLAPSGAVRRVSIITEHEDAARAAVGGPVFGLDVSFVRLNLAPWRERRRAVMAARAWAGTCWRGGIAGLTVFDEVFDPRLIADAMRAEGTAAPSAALVFGPDWRHLDADLTRAVTDRHREHAASFPLAFTQAPPGLCGCVVSRDLIDELARGANEGSLLATIGSVLGYRPLNARSDPIAMPCCVGVEAGVRDTRWRFIPDEISGAAGEIFARQQLDDQRAASLCLAARCAMESTDRAVCEAELIIGEAGKHVPFEALEHRLRRWAEHGPALTLRGSSHADAAAHPELPRLLASARTMGFRAVHVRTSLEFDAENAAFERALAALGESADVVSVNFVAADAETYLALTWRDRHALVMERADQLLRLRRNLGGLPFPWIVPRITRCDAVYEQIEGFFDKSLLVAGWAVIDPLEAARLGERIEPLPLPDNVRRHAAFTKVVIDADGTER
ncbi:MAG: motility associated factor glycosyltransferase family protein [Phycisphaerales bacterium]